MLNKEAVKEILNKALIDGREDYWLQNIKEEGVKQASIRLKWEINNLLDRAREKNKLKIVKVLENSMPFWRDFTREILYDLIEKHKDRIKEEGVEKWEYKLFLIDDQSDVILDNIVKMPIRDERYVYIHHMYSYYSPRYRRPKSEGIELLKTGIWDRIFAYIVGLGGEVYIVDEKGFLDRFTSPVDAREISKVISFCGVNWSNVDRLEEMLQVKSGVEGIKERLLMIADKAKRIMVRFERFSDLCIRVNFGKDKYDYSEIQLNTDILEDVFQDDAELFVDYINYLFAHLERLRENEELKKEINKTGGETFSIATRDIKIDVSLPRKNPQLENELKSYVINNHLMPKDYLEAKRIEPVLDSIMKISL